MTYIQGPNETIDNAIGGDSGPTCLDECVLGVSSDDHPSADAVCAIFDTATGRWVEPDQAKRLRDRARLYDMWLREHMLPAGGVADADFATDDLGQVRALHGVGDSAIWTGTYLAAEALRALTTASPEAITHVGEIVRTLHLWFNISGDPGYLARFAAPTSSPQMILDQFGTDPRRYHLSVPYEGDLWNWIGQISRDQYQGVMLGYSLAYEATTDEAVRELIRHDVVELVEQLMKTETKAVRVVINGMEIPFDLMLDFQYTVFTDDETTSGKPIVDIRTQNIEDSNIHGFQEFMPNYAFLLDQIPGISIGTIPRTGSAIMLASFFKVALQVTEGVPAYANRRAAIAAHYDANVSWWLDIADRWTDISRCGSSYYGLNISFQPMYNLARLETDPALRRRIVDNLLTDRMWKTVEDHKNVFFAFIWAGNQDSSSHVDAIASYHANQLSLFALAPHRRLACNLTDQYNESDACPGNSEVATDLNHRCAHDFTWQRHPWHLTKTGGLRVYPGVDYLVAYWMGRYHGFIDDDASTTCLRMRR